MLITFLLVVNQFKMQIQIVIAGFLLLLMAVGPTSAQLTGLRNSDNQTEEIKTCTKEYACEVKGSNLLGHFNISEYLRNSVSGVRTSHFVWPLNQVYFIRLTYLHISHMIVYQHDKYKTYL